ncbi:MAG: helix-turn-helix domain-containing protein [Clostridia bacterium]|nr:helix-turn-helix domain-containing protein [Clostridia bacterium]
MALLTTEELARELGCSVRTVKRMMAEGRIPVVRVGRRLVRFDLERVLERLSVEEETPPRRGRPRKRLVLGGGLRVANSP